VMLVVSVAFWIIKGRKTYLRVDPSEEVVLEALHLEDSYVEVPVPSRGDAKGMK
jgi:choline transport protein